MKLTTTPELTVTHTTTIQLAPIARQMVTARITEHTQLAAQIRELESRQARCKQEVEDILLREGAGQALLDGLSVAGHKVKMVVGMSSSFDRVAFMKATGTTARDFEAHTTKKAKQPYIRITAPGSGDGDE